MTGQGSAEAEAVEAAVEGYYGKRIETLRMLAAGVPEGLVEVLKPQLDRLEAALRDWRAEAWLPDETVLDLYLNTFDPEHPEDDLWPLPDAAAEDERRARLLLRGELEALGYGLEPNSHAPPAAAAPRWPTGSALSGDLYLAERHVLEQYRLAIRAALTAARLEPIDEKQEYLYFPFASRVPAPIADGLPQAAGVPGSEWWHARGVELAWGENPWPKEGRGWSYGPLDIWLGAGWEWYEPLPLPPFAHPEDIVDVVRQLLTGDRHIVPRTREWEHADALTVLLEQIKALERSQRELGYP
ncbi:hypothetical protein [Kitasatospora griseola]|uniref:hypothetical protein n=1 Tax=Kitasatospora griseola TaxID=2064 RepID=UPI0036571709